MIVKAAVVGRRQADSAAVVVGNGGRHSQRAGGRQRDVVERRIFHMATNTGVVCDADSRQRSHIVNRQRTCVGDMDVAGVCPSGNDMSCRTSRGLCFQCVAVVADSGERRQSRVCCDDVECGVVASIGDGSGIGSHRNGGCGAKLAETNVSVRRNSDAAVRGANLSTIGHDHLTAVRAALSIGGHRNSPVNRLDVSETAKFDIAF